jgi:hypothetical protein
MRATIILTLAIAACATAPERSELRQGAFRPAPPAFNPTTDAQHTVGQPGYLPEPRVTPQPQPHPERLLPPTKEPGIWATRQPPEQLPGWRDREPTVLGVRLPYPVLERDLLESDMLQTRRCAAVAGAVLGFLMTKIDVSALSVSERACLAARMYFFCTARDGMSMKRAVRQGATPSEETMRVLGETKLAALNFLKARCAPPAESDVVKKWAEQAENNWHLTDWVQP